MRKRRAQGALAAPMAAQLPRSIKATNLTYASLNMQAHSLDSTRTKHSPLLQMGRTSSTSRETDTIKILLHELQHVCHYLNKNWGKGKNPIPAGQEEPEMVPKVNDRLDLWTSPETPGVSHLQIKHCASLIQRTAATVTSNYFKTRCNVWHFSGCLLKNRWSVIPKQTNSSWKQIFQENSILRNRLQPSP